MIFSRFSIDFLLEEQSIGFMMRYAQKSEKIF